MTGEWTGPVQTAGLRGGRRTLRVARCLLSSVLIVSLPAAAMAQSGQMSRAVDTSVPLGSPLFGAAGTNAIASSEAQGTQSAGSLNGGAGAYVPAQRDDLGQAGDAGVAARGARSADLETGSQDRPQVRQPAAPNEFELFVRGRLGRSLPRFGASLVVPSARDFAAPATTTVPAAYILQPGDSVFIGLTGSVEGSFERTIDTSGRIFLPRVGSVRLAGVSFGDLRTVLERAVGLQYRAFNVNVSVARLRGVRVYVTGFANNPGAYTVNSLSTLVNAVLAAGGPAAGGSFRSMKLFRNGELVSDFDLYELIRNGNRSRDVVLQNEDVVSIAPVGEQVALTGSLNDEAIYEAKPGESLQDLLRYGGGVNDLADRTRVILYRLANLDTVGGVEVSRAALATTLAQGGDVVQVLSVGTLVRSLERQSVLVRIDGEVARPGNYQVPPGTPLSQVVALAGGFTGRAFIYGTKFQRLSVRQQQRESFDEAVRQLEVSLAAAPLVSESLASAANRDTQLAAARAVVTRLREAQPDGRVVLPLGIAAADLPGALTLENNDSIYIPPRPSTVGVFGAVYRPATFLLDGKPLRLRDYLNKAGGTLRVADREQLFVVRANGEVLSRRRGALASFVYPGDVIFVPVKTHANPFWQRVRDVSQILLGAGVTAAAIAALDNN